jgi:hypothetical protein
MREIGIDDRVTRLVENFPDREIYQLQTGFDAGVVIGFEGCEQPV